MDRSPQHLTAADASALGRTARHAAPRSAPADWRPAADRPDPVDVLDAQDEARVPGLVPVRHARMAVSAFTFYRGAAALMAGDLASLPTSGLDVQLCGDAHLNNLGVFASPSRDLVFDLNDFDETLRGPWEWDLLRLATSFTIAADDRGLSSGKTAGVTAQVVAAYRDAMAEWANRSPLDVWYARVDVAEVREALAGSKRSLRNLDEGAAAARRRTSLQAARKLTETVDGRRRFRSDPPLLVPLRDAEDIDVDRLGTAVRDTFAEYLGSLPESQRSLLDRYRVADVAHKVVGVGSVGLRALIVLLEPATGDPMVLQFKEATASVLEAHLPPSPYAHHGQRVVEGQRLAQAASDPFLGWSTSALDGRHYYWRQLRDMKGSTEVATLSAKAIAYYAVMCGRTLARAHARTGSPAAIAAYLGGSDRFERSVVAFARRYAVLNADDHARHDAAIAEGTLPCAEEI